MTKTELKGRPKIPTDQLRTTIALRLNEEEKAIILDAAHGTGLELSTWIRMIALAAAKGLKK
mgnify:CR=1 FL=1